MLYIVTVRLAKNPAHDPRNKVTATCPMGKKRCTDQTGEHHSFLVDSLVSLEEVREHFEATYHVTRVEESMNLVIV